MVPFLYWFIEAYVQLMLVWTGLFLVPPIRRLALRDPFAFGLAFLGAALAARFVGPLLWPIGGRHIFTLPWILYLAVFGWCIVRSEEHTSELQSLMRNSYAFFC